MSEYGGVEHEISVGDLSSINEEAVRHERMPMVKLIKLHSNAVLVLELGTEEQCRVKFQLKVVSAEVLYVLLDHYPNDLTWKASRLSELNNQIKAVRLALGL